jgi:hypothetical protein
MTTYQTGESLRIAAEIVDTDDVAVDPTTVVISIGKPDRSLDITEAAMTKSETGSYYYDYTIASDTGVYYIAVKATGSAGRITIEPGTFDVAAAI